MPALYIRDNNQNTKSYSIANTSTPNYPYVRVNGSYVYLKPKPADEMNLVMRTVTDNVDHQTSTYTVSTSSGSSYYTTASSTGNMSSITASTRVSSYTISEYTQRTTTATSYQTVRSTTATEYYTRASTYDTSYFVRLSTYDTSYMTKASVYGYSGATTSGGFMFSYDDVDYFTEEQGYTDNRGKSQTWTAVWEVGPFAKPAGYGSYTLEEYDYEVTYGTTKQNQYNYSETTKGRDRRFTDIIHPKGYKTLTYTSQFVLGYVTSFSVTGPYGAGRTYRVQTGPLRTVNGTLKYSTTGRDISYKSSEKYSGTTGTSWYDSYTTSYYTRFSVDNAVTGYTTSLYPVGLLSTTALTRSSTYRTIYYTRLSTFSTSYATRQSTSATSYRDRVSTTNTVYVTDRATTSVDSSTRASLIWYSGYSSHTYSTSLSSADTYTTTFPEYVPMRTANTIANIPYWTGYSLTKTKMTTYTTSVDTIQATRTTKTVYLTSEQSVSTMYSTINATSVKGQWAYISNQEAITGWWDCWCYQYSITYVNETAGGQGYRIHIPAPDAYSLKSTLSKKEGSGNWYYVRSSTSSTIKITGGGIYLITNTFSSVNTAKSLTTEYDSVYTYNTGAAIFTYTDRTSWRTRKVTYDTSYETATIEDVTSWHTTRDTRFYYKTSTAWNSTDFPEVTYSGKNTKSGNNWITRYNKVDSFTTLAETTTWM